MKIEMEKGEEKQKQVGQRGFNEIQTKGRRLKNEELKNEV